MRKYTKSNQKLLATFAAKCAQRVLPLFESSFPDDPRPRAAIKATRTWVRTQVFKMSDIRFLSLSSHAAARAAKTNLPACYAARAAGHSIATPHVPQHAYGSAYYALKSLAASNPAKVAKEFQYQSKILPQHLLPLFHKIIIIESRNNQPLIKFHKGKDF